MRPVANALLVSDRLGRNGANLLFGADRPAAEGDLGLVSDLIVIDRIAFEILAADLADIEAVKALLDRVPIVEAAVFPGEVGVIQVRGIKGVVERGRRLAVE